MIKNPKIGEKYFCIFYFTRYNIFHVVINDKLFETGKYLVEEINGGNSEIEPFSFYATNEDLFNSKESAKEYLIDLYKNKIEKIQAKLKEIEQL
jgi:hypothetical protein